jgi:hypothetical protein
VPARPPKLVPMCTSCDPRKPAMAAGVADHVWTLGEIAALLRGGCGIIGRTDSAATDEIGAAVRWNRTTTNSARRELRP